MSGDSPGRDKKMISTDTVAGCDGRRLVKICLAAPSLADIHRAPNYSLEFGRKIDVS